MTVYPTYQPIGEAECVITPRLRELSLTQTGDF